VNVKRTVTIEIRRTHWAIADLVEPALRELLLYREMVFESGGPLGHRMWATDSDYLTPVFTRRWWLEDEGRPDVREVQALPQGLVPVAADLLRLLGHEVDVKDLREDSPRWERRPDWKKCVEKANRAVVGAVGEHRALRVVGFNDDRVADTVAALALAYPEARIAVAVATYELLGRVLRRLSGRITDPLGLYTARKRRDGRVSVGLIGQFPLAGRGDWDVLVLPHGESSLVLQP
jgi:hypothetical protein